MGWIRSFLLYSAIFVALSGCSHSELQNFKPVDAPFDRAVIVWSQSYKNDFLTYTKNLKTLEDVNSAWNKIPYVSDNKDNIWKTPGEFLARGGDCEDYAIAKYYTLKGLGYSEDDMRILVVYDIPQKLYHAILAIRVGDKVMIMDNQFKKVYELKDAAKKYTLIHALNANGFRNIYHAQLNVDIFR